MTEWRQGQLTKLYQAMLENRAGGLTQLEAAKVLGVKKSIYVKQLLDELAQNSDYVVKEWNGAAKHPGWVWRAK